MTSHLQPEPIQSIRAFVENEGEFLLLQRNQDVEQAGLWEFPGGKKDGGESLVDTALRETFEETGIEITPVSEVIKLCERVITDGKHAGRLIIEHGLFATSQSRALAPLTEHANSLWELPVQLFTRTDLTRVMPAALQVVRGNIRIF